MELARTWWIWLSRSLYRLFTDWSEVNLIKKKSASTVAQFLYKVICRYGGFLIQVNDQRQEFVNGVPFKFLWRVKNHIWLPSLVEWVFWCFQGVEKGCIGNERVNGMFSTHHISLHSSTKCSLPCLRTTINQNCILIFNMTPTTKALTTMRSCFTELYLI